MKEFYSAKDISQITGLAKSASYSLLNKLQEKIKKEIPGYIIVTGRIPINYFNEKCCYKKILVQEKEKENEKEKNIKTMG